jgi:hypothetical protein
MAVELKNRLDKATTKKLRSTLIFDYPTLETLSQHLANQMLIIEPKNSPQSVEQTPKEHDLFQLNDLFDALENISDDDITQQFTN